MQYNATALVPLSIVKVNQKISLKHNNKTTLHSNNICSIINNKNYKREAAGECDAWLLMHSQSHSHILIIIHNLTHNQAKQLENVMLGYLCTHALYKFFYILNWVHRYYNEVTMMRTKSYISYIIYDNWQVKKIVGLTLA